MPSNQGRISIEFKDPAHPLSPNYFGQLPVEVPLKQHPLHEFYIFPVTSFIGFHRYLTPDFWSLEINYWTPSIKKVENPFSVS